MVRPKPESFSDISQLDFNDPDFALLYDKYPGNIGRWLAGKAHPVNLKMAYGIQTEGESFMKPCPWFGMVVPGRLI